MTTIKNPQSVPFSLIEETVLRGICTFEILKSDSPERSAGFTFVERINPLPLEGAVVRTRMDGDFMRPLGLNGKKKLVSDIMTDRKIPLPLRNRLPVVAKGSEVFWLVGAGISDAIKTGKNTSSITVKAIFNHKYGGEIQ